MHFCIRIFFFLHGFLNEQNPFYVALSCRLFWRGFLCAGGAGASPPAPEIAARAYMLVDVTAGQTLAGKDIDAPVEQASLTKLMTGYLVFDALRQKSACSKSCP